jgi:tRNA threonylcarbamoyl adenosine modification protein YeaZ
MKLTLVVERSAPVGSWALYRDETQVASRCFGAARLRAPEWAAELLAGLAEQGVAPAALQQLVVGTGPGSFSGIRAAIALLQGVALPRNLPVYGLASAAVLARAMALESRREMVAVVGDARRQHLWCAVYRCGSDGRLVLASTGGPPRHTSEDFALTTWEKLGDVVPADALVISPEWERLADGFRGKRIGSACHAAPLIPSAGDLGALFFSDCACARRDPVPVYLHPAVV